MTNYNGQVQASGARTTSGFSATQINRDCTGVVLEISTTANSGTDQTLVVKVQGSTNGTDWYDIPGASTPTINSNGDTFLTVRPGVTVVANSSVAQAIPRLWRVAWTIAGTTPSFTFSVDAAMLQ